MNKLLDIVGRDTAKWDYLKQFVPGLDYKIETDFRRANNVVGHQQRAFTTYWAIKRA